MSSTLMCRPTGDGKMLPDELKYKLERKISGHTIFDSSDIPYLRGLVDCDVKGAKTLIEMIEKHESVTVWLTY